MVESQSMVVHALVLLVGSGLVCASALATAALLRWPTRRDETPDLERYVGGLVRMASIVAEDGPRRALAQLAVQDHEIVRDGLRLASDGATAAEVRAALERTLLAAGPSRAAAVRPASPGELLVAHGAIVLTGVLLLAGILSFVLAAGGAAPAQPARVLSVAIIGTLIALPLLSWVAMRSGDGRSAAAAEFRAILQLEAVVGMVESRSPAAIESDLRRLVPPEGGERLRVAA